MSYKQQKSDEIHYTNSMRILASKRLSLNGFNQNSMSLICRFKTFNLVNKPFSSVKNYNEY